MITPEFPISAYVAAPEKLVLNGGRWTRIQIPVRYGVFRHPQLGTCLIDTGYSSRVTTGRRSFPLWLYANILRPKLTDSILPSDVSAILVSHLHADHISALRDYPNARILLDGEALAHYRARSWFGRTRKGCFAELFPDDLSERAEPFESFPIVDAPFGLGAARDVFSDGSVLAVPLPGHMRGHTGFVFAQRPTPLLYAADADWLRVAILEGRSPGFPASHVLDDPAAAAETAQRIRRFVERGGDLVLCHDPEIGA
jgi:glyoxylase-like metal-dependent hydrolase (beta-lactamase superfamily II)